VPYLPGVVAYLVLQGWFLVRGSFDVAAVDYLWQSLGVRALTDDPWASLWSLHIQPPGLNTWYAVALHLPGGPEWVLRSTLLVLGLLTVVLVVATLREVRVAPVVAGIAGLVYALLPTTVLMSLWPYNATVLAFFAALLGWGSALLRRRPTLGITMWVIATLGLFLWRPSYLWVVVIAWLVLAVRLVPAGRRRRALAIAGGGVVVVLAVQAHYLLSFGLATTSSWSGQNLAKGLVWSGAVTGDDLMRAAVGDACTESMALDPQFWGSIDQLSPTCFGARADLDGRSVALDEPLKADGTYQQNEVRRLELADAWSRLAARTVAQDPWSVARMALGYADRPSSIELLLRPGVDNPFLAANIEAGGPVVTVLRPLGAVFPAGALAVIALAALWQVQRRAAGRDAARVFWVGTAFLGYVLAVAVALEWGENSRYLVEVYPTMTVLAALGASWLMGGARDGDETA
jgi:hypothetical protein